MGKKMTKGLKWVVGGLPSCVVKGLVLVALSVKKPKLKNLGAVHILFCFCHILMAAISLDDRGVRSVELPFEAI